MSRRSLKREKRDQWSLLRSYSSLVFRRGGLDVYDTSSILLALHHPAHAERNTAVRVRLYGFCGGRRR